MEEKRNKSSSAVQQALESVLIQSLSDSLNCALRSLRVSLADCEVQLDGYYRCDESRTITIAEAYARTKPLNSGSKRKILTDVLKLAFVADRLADQNPDFSVRRFLVVADESIARALSGDAWAAKAIENFGIQIRVEKLSEAQRQQLDDVVAGQDLRSDMN